ncbi:nitroreductase/quinone reductase family protein [Herbidospora mongoliensis]|uniref:nitroreductase/quinone reductase family protein n=1 Tax=Herbidospora mongoliensis TaxID=688067 RepID=UPI000831C5B5|nr:nitroreductase/quinone reductase family protein [Herbidospora mongoliensis]
MPCRLPRKPVARFNACVMNLRTSPRWGGLVSRHLTVLTYTGRRSGRTFSIPVGYRRTGDIVVIGSQMPDAKLWWRNFLGEGGPVSVELDGTDRTGHAVTRRDAKGRVTVTVTLDR